MQRRAFMGVLAGGLLAKPLAAEAQPSGQRPVVGVLNSGIGPRSPSVDTMRQGLRDLGWVEGQTIAFEVRFAGAKPHVFPELAIELVRRKVDLIFVSGPAGIRAARDATSTIPIVALDLESDPVQAGFARSLAQPGGNLTGCFLDQPGLTGKWLELVGEVVPGARRIAVLRDPTTGPWQLDAIQTAARTRGIELQILEVRGSEDLGPTLERGAKGGARALIQLSSPLFDGVFAERIAAFTVTRRLAAISMFRRFAAAGGLLAYGPDQPLFYRRLAIFIDKILKGAKPADLPVEQPTKFELVINLKTAKALGLTIPPSLLARADQVIQ